MVERLAFGLFVLGLAFLGYLYGVASARFGLFPYEIVQDAWIGGKALRELWADDFDEKPPGAQSFEAHPWTAPSAAGPASGAQREQELILVTGGSYKLMSECPELGCLAWIMDRAGTVYHTWPLQRHEPWGYIEEARGFSQIDDLYPESLHLYDNGDLLVSYQARGQFPYSVGLAKFDKDGKVLWRKDSFSHHWFYVDDGGLIYAPSHEIIDSPLSIPGTQEQLICDERKIYEDVILILSPDGEIVRRISVLQALFDSGYGGLVYLTRIACDPLHLNDVRILTEADAFDYPEFSPGDMLISLRNVNTLAVLDSATARIKWIATGLTIEQHAPRFLGDDRILAFDNLGGPAAKGGSRLVEIDLATGEASTVFPLSDTPAELDFFTEIAGHIDLNAERSRALVALTMPGRVLEIDLATGEVLWEYDHIYDVTEYMAATGQGEEQRFARFGINGAYFVERADFLADDQKQMVVR